MGWLNLFKSKVKEESISNPDPNERLGLQFYRFLGGNMNHTRPFCKEKNGKYFHYREIMEWANEDWEGKHPDTDSTTIFQYVGGFCSEGDKDEKCHHMLMPTSTFAVPKEDILRAYNTGYYKPTLTEREYFGID